MTECTCNRCGWVHMAVTRKFAEQQVDEFNVYFDSLSDDDQQKFYRGRCASMSEYERCLFCGQTDQDFREAVDDDCPVGCTIQPTIWEPPC